MSNLSDIKRRITSVKQTRQITGAMETVSVAKMRKALELYDRSNSYTAELRRVMAEVAYSSDIEEIFDVPQDGRRAIVVFSTDRGLCGGFDHDIFKTADGVCDESTVVMPVGQTAAARYASRADGLLDVCCADAYSADSMSAERIANRLLDAYGNGINRIDLVFAEMQTRSAYKPTVKPLLPFVKPQQSEELARTLCLEPSAAEVFSALLPAYVTGSIYGALVNNIAAEHCARHAAMSAATESADEIINKLSIEYNRARQSTVTEQIVEIIGSTEALKKQGVGSEKRP